MEKTVVLMGRIFGMKKMDFSKVEHADVEKISNLFKYALKTNENKDVSKSNQSKDTLKVNQINNPELKHLISIEQNLKNIWNEMQARTEDENKEIKWKYAAIVMDRLLFFLTLIYSFITFCSTVLSIPNLYKFT
jgi:hypothetical protein